MHSLARLFTFLLILAFVLASCSTSIPPDIEVAMEGLPEVVDYNFHVKPILADRCYQCHGPDENTRMGGLRLDIEEEAFARLSSGNKALVKGSAGSSEVFHRILSDDPEVVMPPPESKLTLTAAEKATIIKWIDQGAEWKQHWSFIDVERPQVPEPVEDWEQINVIDNFIQEKLQLANMSPNPVAEKERLLRRVTMDLTGLPPTIQEINEFVNDESPNAYEKVVDRLLSSSAHAERLAIEWMDLARYSDSHGVSFDGARTSWPYRDWLINAFQGNMAYDQFIREQVAGDMLDNPTRDQRIATSFYRMGQMEASQGSIPEEFRVEYVAERTGLTGTALMGLTMECARCHDHKFDPISQKEFYQLSAFFNTTEEMGLGPADADRPPTLMLFDSAELVLLDSLNREIDLLQGEVVKSLTEIEQLKTYAANFEKPKADKHFSLDVIETYKKKKKKPKKDKEEKEDKDASDKKEEKEKKEEKDEFEEVQFTDGNKEAEAQLGVTLVDGKNGKAAFFDDEYDFLKLQKTGLFELYGPFSVGVWVHTDREGIGPTQTIMGNSGPYAADYRGWDLYLDSTMHVRARLIHRLPDDYIEVVSKETIESGRWSHVGLTYDGSGMARGLRLYLDGQLLTLTASMDALSRSIYPVDEDTFEQDTTALIVGRSRRAWTYDVGLLEGAVDEIDIFHRELSLVEMGLLGDRESEFSNNEIKEYQALNNTNYIEHREQLLAVKNKRRQVLDTVQEIMVLEEMAQPRKTYLLERGLYNQHGEEVEPSMPEFILEYRDEFPRNRLGLAEWLVDERNPLTSRVAVNRYWQMIFGRGIVKTPDDFGSQGALPTHPELLDWLAAEFMESGWNLRHMLKLMVMSATYRQSSHATFDMMEQDPENLYYARSPSYRWPAEFIRDNLLAASGLLVDKVGGPPVKPYQPEGLWEEFEVATNAFEKYKMDTLESLYRRSIYTIQRRFIPPPFMNIFDASTREICQVRRDKTNSPLQALALMNDPQVIEASRILSERILHASDNLSDQIILGYKLSTGVTPNENQVLLLSAQYKSALEHFEAHTSEADSLLTIGERPYDTSLEKHRIAAMAMVANTIFNYDESLMKR